MAVSVVKWRVWIPILGYMLMSLGSTASAEEPGKINTRALAEMKRSAEFIAKLESYHFRATMLEDRIDASGQVIEHGSVRNFYVRRPDRIRVEIEHNSGDSLLFTANPRKVAASRNSGAKFAEIDSPGSLDDVIDLLIMELGVRPPLANLVYSNLWRVLRPRIESAQYVGEVKLGSARCHHLAFRNEDVDWQIWIDAGEQPLPRRMVIHYKSEPGGLTVRASIDQWNVQSAHDPSQFDQKASEGAKKVSLSELAR